MWKISKIATWLWLLVATGTAACSDSSYGRDEINRSLLENFNDNSDNLAEKHDTYQVDFDTFKVALDTVPQKPEIQQIDSISPDIDRECHIVQINESFKKSPLFMRWTRRHVWEFLWYNQYKDILSKYNTYDSNKLEEAKYSINSLDSLSFPLIVDWLEQFFPEKAEDMIQSEDLSEYRDSLINEEDFIVVKNEWGKYVLWYYKWWKLYLATHVSIWTWNNTPEWFFRLWAKYSRNVSRKYNNAPMPYTIVVDWNICMHQWKVTGDKLSHGCIRVPGLYQQVMYSETQEWTPIVLLP